jgi:ribonuclease P protein component
MNTFKKEERLCSVKVIDTVFKEGNEIDYYPFKVLWIEAPDEGNYPMQLAIAVPKRNFKKATQRNLIKRRIREAFRLHKHPIYTALALAHKRLYVVFIYISKEELPFATLEKSIIALLEKLSNNFN